MGTFEGLILIIVAVIAAILLDAASRRVLRRFRPKTKTEEQPPVQPEPPAGPYRSRVGRLTKGWLGSDERWVGIEQAVNRWGRPILLLAVVLLAAVPSAIVMLDRWFNLTWAADLLSNIRGVNPYLDAMPLPAYFILFLLLLLVAGLLIAFFPLDVQSFMDLRTGFQAAEDGIPNLQIRISQLLRWIALTEFVLIAAFSIAENRIPGAELAMVAGFFVAGWLLREYSLDPVWRAIQQNRDVLFACALVHVALIAVLTAYHTCQSCLPITVVALVLAIIYLFPYRNRVPAIYWIFSLGLILFSINVNAWWMSVVGDEYGFYESARAVADRFNLSEIFPRFFDELGVFGINPYLSSIVQGVFMKLFGTQGFGWRFSNIYLIALSIPLFYFFLKTFLDRRIALLACLFLAASHYLINFSKIGYVNLQALFVLCASLAAAAWAVRSGRTAAYAICGIVLALNFYVYGIAIVSLLLALLLLIFFAPPFSRAALRSWLILLIGFGILFFPLLFQPDYWKTGLGFTIFGYSEAIPASANAAQLFVYRIMTSWFSYLYSSNESHFVSVSFVDGITAGLVGIGFFVILYRIRKSRFAAFFLIGWALLLIVAGIIGSPDRPGTSRMFVVLPWWFAAAAFGLWWIREQILSIGAAGSKIPRVWIGGFFTLVVALNLLNAAVISYSRWMDYQPFEASIERVAEQTSGRDRYVERKFVFITSAEYNLVPFLIFREVYPQYWSNMEIDQVKVDGPSYPESAISMEDNLHSVIFVLPSLPEEWRLGVQASLETAGFMQCPVSTPSGKWQYDMFVPKEMAWVCTDLK